MLCIFFLQVPADKSQIILSIIAASVFVLLIVVASFLLFRILIKKKNRLLVEQEKLKRTYEQTLFQSKLEMQEMVFTQISREIHDNIGQTLSLVRLNLNTMDLPEERIAATDELLARAIADLRHLSHSMNSNYIRETGFVGAVKGLLDNLSKTRQFKTSLAGTTVDTYINEEKGIILFRIVQEVINNIVRHAKAATIDTIITEKPGGFALSISDDGIGFNVDRSGQSYGLGLKNIIERAAMIHASVNIESCLGKGTTITIEMKNAYK